MVMSFSHDLEMKSRLSAGAVVSHNSQNNSSDKAGVIMSRKIQRFFLLQELLNSLQCLRILLCYSLSAIALLGNATAQSYPSSPIKVVVTYAPGGGSDVLARMLAPELGKNLGQPIVIDNRAGAGGSVGTAAVARMPADGYNLLFMSLLPHTVSKGIYAKLSYDPISDFVPLGGAVSIPYVIVVNSALPVKTLQELIALGKANPGKYNFESAGFGSSTHLVGELFKNTFKVDFTHVPYKGGGPGLTALIGGEEVQLAFENLPGMMAQIKAGTIRPLAVTSGQRSPSLPDVPTIAELGYPEFQVTGIFGYLAPAGTPKDIVARINSAINKTMKSPSVIQQVAAAGGQTMNTTPAEFGAMLNAESKRWLGITKDLGIKPE